MAKHLRWCGLFIVLGLLTTAALDFSGPASAQSRTALRRKAHHVHNKITAVQSSLRNIKAEQATARDSLTRAQVELGQAQDRLAQARQRLSSTRSALKVVKKQYAQASKRHLLQKKLVEARILAQYEAGSPSYLEVVLNATTFADFTERTEMTETIAERDQKSLANLLAAKEHLANTEVELQRKEQEAAQRKIEVQKERNEVAVKAQIAHQRLVLADTNRAEAERQLAALEEASREIQAMMVRIQREGVSAGAYAGTWSGGFLRPVPGPITSPFGWRMHPLLHTMRFHDGEDIGCPEGTPIHAAAKGRVVHAGWWGAYGVAVIIDDGSGVSTLYGHCERGSLRVGVGDIVKQGQVIALVDSTGWSTGNHLHFGVMRNGKWVRPPF